MIDNDNIRLSSQLTHTINPDIATPTLLHTTAEQKSTLQWQEVKDTRD